jgi:Kef-type K+ transport system membrane component KefB
VTEQLRWLLIIVFVAALAPLVADLPKRIRIPVVVSEITLGILIGPEVLGWAEPEGLVTFMSTLGLIFLFFLAGLEVDFDRIRGVALKLGGWGWALSATLAMTFAGSLHVAGFVISGLIVGIALCTTAIGTLMPILRDSGELETEFGPFVLAAGVAGEFGPLMLMSIFLTTGSRPIEVIALLVVFLLVSAAAAVVALKARPSRVVTTIQRTMRTSAQLALRLSLAVLFGLVYLAYRFGFDIILGGFAAGLVVGLVTKGEEAEELRLKFEGIGFGFLVPIFFVVTGMTFDLDALFSSLGAVLRLPLFLGFFLVIRGAPALLLYRKALPRGDHVPLALYSATALPIVVAVTTIGLETDRMSPVNAAALVGAAMTSVLVFPLVALRLRRRSGRLPASTALAAPASPQ